MFPEQQVGDVPLTEMESWMCWENFYPVVWTGNRFILGTNKNQPSNDCQRSVWSFSLRLNMFLKTASDNNSLDVSEWPPSTVDASVLWSKGWNTVLSEIREAEKSGQIVIAVNYSLVEWRNASSNWVLERIFGCLKWLLPRTTSL